MASPRIFQFIDLRQPRMRRRAVLVGGTALVMIVLFMGVVYAWDYMSTPAFCGTTCHTMPVEYPAYQRSPHARVDCVNCHIGKGVNTAIATRIEDSRHVIDVAFTRYELPITVRNLRPSRDTCEKCHWPEKFYGDKIREIKRYQDDEKNTETRTYLIMKTRGGSSRDGLSMGIHWHVEADVYYVATDKFKQDIPWVQVIDKSGKKTEYLDVSSKISAEEIARLPKRRMDCIDCHNRASHLVRSPELSMDNLLALQRIDKSIPFIEKKGVEVLNARYPSPDDAMKAIDGLDGFYRSSYPDTYSKKSLAIKTAIDLLKTTYKETNFPHLEVDWQTYPNNVGHKEFPGCFRCHDGKHLATDTAVPAERNNIRLQCNICHSIPRTVTEGQPPPHDIPIVTLTEPASHLAGDWMAKHRSQVSPACQSCHGPIKYSPKPDLKDQSFCANVSCHGTGWKKYVSLIEAQPSVPTMPPPTPTPAPTVAPAAGATATATAPAVTAPDIPHTLEGRDNCLLCHGPGGAKPVPADHAGRANDSCRVCHQPKR